MDLSGYIYGFSWHESMSSTPKGNYEIFATVQLAIHVTTFEKFPYFGRFPN